MVFKIIGWIGVLLYVSAYLLLTLQYLKVTKIKFHLLNILGAVCLIINAWAINDYPNIVVNMLWAFIGFFAVYKTNAKKAL